MYEGALVKRKNCENSAELAASEKRLEFEQLLVDLSAKFVAISSEKVDDEIRSALREIVRFFRIDRCALVRLLPGRTSWAVAYDAEDASVSPYPIGTVLPISLVPWAYHRLSVEREFFSFASLDELPSGASVDRQTMESFNVRSGLYIPIAVMKSDEYTLGISSSENGRTCPQEYIPRLRLLGELIVNALERKRMETELREHLKEIEHLKLQLEKENIALRDEIKAEKGFEKIIGDSDALNYVLFRIKQVAPTDATVLILGETGTGKELVARSIHSRSDRRAKPFVTINCAAVPENLLESEFFGHEKGAFSGAVSQRIGKFEKAHTGTLFLDEIGDIPLDLQAKILRVIEDGKITRLGSNREIDCDFRVICATNRPIQDMIRKELFREDLFYRISVFPVIIPPLRKRKDDISLLVDHFIKKYSAKFGSPVKGVSREAMNQLLAYHWPGNVREMENAVQRAIVSCRTERIETLPDLGRNLHEAVSAPVEEVADAPTIWVDAGGGAGYHEIKQALIEQFERKYFEHLLKKHGGVIAEAARESGLNYKTFYLKAEKYNLTKKRLRMEDRD